MGINSSRAVANRILDACDSASSDRASPESAGSAGSTRPKYISLSNLDKPEFLDHLRDLLRDVRAQSLPERLASVVESYISFKPCLSFKTTHNVLVDQWVKSPASFLDLIPRGDDRGDDLAYRLYQGSHESKDKVLKRLCMVFFYKLRIDFNETFHAGGHRDALAKYFTRYKLRPPGEFLTKARHLCRLYDQAPALLFLEVETNIWDFEAVLPNDEYRLKDAITEMSLSMPESVEIYNGIEVVFQYLQGLWKQWLQDLEYSNKRKHEIDIGASKARKKTTRTLLSTSSTASKGTEPGVQIEKQDRLPPPRFLDTPTKTQDSNLLLPLRVSSTPQSIPPTTLAQQSIPSRQFIPQTTFARQPISSSDTFRSVTFRSWDVFNGTYTISAANYGNLSELI